MFRLLLITLVMFVLCQHSLHAEEVNDGSCAAVGKSFSVENSENKVDRSNIKNAIKDGFKGIDKILIKNTGNSYLDSITEDQLNAMVESVFLSCAWVPRGNIAQREIDVFHMMAGPAWP